MGTLALPAFAVAGVPIPSGGVVGGAANTPAPINVDVQAVDAGQRIMINEQGLASKVIVSNLQTVKVPENTILRLRVMNEIDSRNVRVGEGFNAFVDEPLFGPGGQVLLPRGTVLRGRIDNVQRSKFFGRGGQFSLDFDHVTLPTGEIMPIDLKLGSVNQLSSTVREGNALYEDPGYGTKFSRSADKSGYLLTDVTRRGYEAGVDAGGKGLGAVTGTFSAIGGAIAAGGYLVGKSVYHAVAPGDPATLNADDAIYMELLKDTQIPVL